MHTLDAPHVYAVTTARWDACAKHDATRGGVAITEYFNIYAIDLNHTSMLATAGD